MRVSSGQVEAPSEPLEAGGGGQESITPDHIVCLEDGKKFKSLKRHLRTQYNMTPEQYREKWGLAPDYPMVAPNYAAARSQLAKQMGLGQHGAGGSKPLSNCSDRATASRWPFCVLTGAGGAWGDGAMGLQGRCPDYCDRIPRILLTNRLPSCHLGL